MVAARKDPPSFAIKEVFEYRDGQLFWRQKKKGRKLDKPVGYKMTNGYLCVSVEKRWFYIHRLVYFYHTGIWPELIDHIDCNKENNAIENLREASKSINGINRKDIQSNNKSGFNGVYWSKRAKKWIAQSTRNRKATYLGCFEDPVDAAKAVKKHISKLAEQENH